MTQVPDSVTHHAVVSFLAERSVAYHAGSLIGLLAIPVAGLIMLIVGLRQRSRSRVQPGPYPPGYPPQFPPMPGYPGYPPQPGPWPTQPPPSYPPAPYPGFPPGIPVRRRTASSSTALIAVGSVLLVLGVLGIAGRLAGAGSTGPEHPTDRPGNTTAAGQLQVGQCIAEFNIRIGMLPSTPDDCTAAESVYEVAATGGPQATCPDGKRDASVYSILTNESVTLCLLLNLKQGDCYTRLPGASMTTMSPVDCDNTRQARVKATKRVDGSTETGLCPTDTTAVAYPSPARVYCLGG